MGINKEVLSKERNYLEKVKEILLKRIEEESAGNLDKENSINDLKRFMWENLSDYSDEERLMALYEVDREVDKVNDNIMNVEQLKRAFSSPYFGKVVFFDKELDETLDIYVGMRSVEEDMNFYVFDWRSPISSLFYNFELGDAYYMAPCGKIDGEILSKMQFKIEKGELKRCFNCDINIEDDFLQEILANSSSDKMQNIVSSIQREQNNIIRNENDKYLIVQGVAGSGKTSVAMHRIAYLLYRDNKLNSNNVLIFSPNEVFSDYISSVLPELGEKNVLKTTFSDFAFKYLDEFEDIESYTDYLDRVYSNKNNSDIVKYKMSDEFIDDIKKFISKYEESFEFGSGLSIKDNVYSADEIKSLLERYKKLPLSERLTEVSESIYNTCLSRTNVPYIKNKLINLGNIELNHIKLYKRFLESKGLTFNVNGKLKYEDVIGLLYFNFYVNDLPAVSYIKHLVIDEAQDYTLGQMELFRRIFRNASFTILGDVNQTINPYYKYTSMESLKDIFDDARYLELTKAYRSTPAIMGYAKDIIGMDTLAAIRVDNDVPVKIKNVNDEELVKTLSEDISLMKNDGYKKIAIIAKDSYSASDIYTKLNSSMDISLLGNNSTKLSGDTFVVPAYLSKGLEFDGVIVVNSNNNTYSEDERNLYYVACTRAQHKLNIYNEPKIKIKK